MPSQYHESHPDKWLQARGKVSERYLILVYALLNRKYFRDMRVQWGAKIELVLFQIT